MFGLREKINLRIYGSKDTVIKLLGYVSFFSALFAIALLLYYYGFPQSDESAHLVINIIKLVLGYFVFQYVLRLFYSFDVLELIKANWFEGLLVFLLIFDGISLYVFNIPLLQVTMAKLGIQNIKVYYLIFIQLYLLLVAVVELIKTGYELKNININPSASLILSLLVLSFVGAGLLVMPEMTTKEGSMRFFDALFTSVSAISQTGLIVVNTGAYFTFKGHLVIMFLIQVGALGIISFGTFFASYMSKGLSLKRLTSFHDFFVSDIKINTKDLFRQIIYYTIIIDVLGAAMIFFFWGSGVHFESLGNKIFFSVFHSVSAFCNAGFSLYGNSLYEEGLRHAYLLHLSVIVLIFLGSLGYPTLIDLFGVKNIKERRKRPWKGWRIDTKISVYTSVGLIIFGL